MGEQLLSVGLDVGTTSTQLIVSRLQVENRASGFAVPKMEITGREILYESPVHFTPLLGGNLVDGEQIRRLVAREYENAGITRSQVNTGAIIITGETSRKENARAVTEALAGFAGSFVAAAAGPDLESVLAAKGAGAAAFSEKTGKKVLHMDIGGGTSNLALIENGKIVATGCLNVGGRLLKFDPRGRVSYVSPVLDGLTDLRLGDALDIHRVQAVAEMLVQALEMAAGLREPTGLLEQLTTKEAAGNLLSFRASGHTGVGISRTDAGDCHGQQSCPRNNADAVISFSGGVADCIETVHPPLAFGDIGPVLGQTIKKSRLCAGPYRLGTHTIRATVIGAGCHSAQLSGSTVFCRNADLPVQNLPVAVLTEAEQTDPAAIRQKLAQTEGEQAVLAMPGYPSPSYTQVSVLAEAIAKGTKGRQTVVCLEQDMAKALGQKLSLLRPEAACLCIDRLKPEPGSYLDIGCPVGPCLPVVIKTLILNR